MTSIHGCCEFPRVHAAAHPYYITTAPTVPTSALAPFPGMDMLTTLNSLAGKISPQGTTVLPLTAAATIPLTGTEDPTTPTTTPTTHNHSKITATNVK